MFTEPIIVLISITFELNCGTHPFLKIEAQMVLTQCFLALTVNYMTSATLFRATAEPNQSNILNLINITRLNKILNLLEKSKSNEIEKVAL